MENKERTFKNVIIKCACDKLLPFALVYMAYVVLHGHLSAGGGFQGGVLMVAVVVLIWLGYGYEEASEHVRPNLLHKLEGFTALLYVFLAFIGIFHGKIC